MPIKLGKSLADMIRIVRTDELIIKPRLDAWLVLHADDPFPEAIAEWVKRQLMTAERDRTRAFNASSSGQCLRRQVLNYIGVPAPGVVDPQLAQIFQDGSWRHLRIQSQMVAAGIIELENLEFPLYWPAMRLKGTADGVGEVPADHPNKAWRGMRFGLEIKGANMFTHNDMVDPSKYMPQLSTYFLSGGFDLFVVYVENKNMQESKEFVIEPDPAWLRSVREELVQLNKFVDAEVLPDRMSTCTNHVGPDWKRLCPYGGSDQRPCMQLPVGHQPTMFP